ncbi:MAG: PEGA domain-containing protein [Sandaracinaceae bacterium]|nr:PEGA domain-containing protein [Sandaracinaceae bacterium]
MRALALLVLLCTGAARAQPPEALDALVITSASDEARAERWRAWLARSGGPTATLVEAAEQAEPVGSFDPARLEALVEIEELILRARSLTARLREAEALRFLARAERLALSVLDVPGAAAWYAEVELAIALSATQAELPALAAAALGRAALVDPSRAILAGEAHPDLVERSQVAIRASVTAPRGSFELSASAPRATAYLDDHELGSLPRRVEAPIGQHVLRVEAPGRAPWARVIEVLEGPRAPVEVQLAPTARLRLAGAIEGDAAAGRLDAVTSGLRAWGAAAPRTVVLSAAGERAIGVVCAPACDEARMLSNEEPVERFAAAPSAPVDRALAWLGSREPRVPPPPGREWWQEWYVWAIVGAVVTAGAAATAAVAAQPSGEPPVVVIVHPP